MRITESPKYWRLSFLDEQILSDWKTIKLSAGLMVIARNEDKQFLVHSMLLAKSKYDMYHAKLASFYYQKLFKEAF